MTASEPAPAAGRAFIRPAVFSLIFVPAFLALEAAQVVYRFSLPTDGWATIDVALDAPQALYYLNLVGLPSELRPMDVVTGMAGRPLEAFARGVRPEFWQAGAVVDYAAGVPGRPGP